MLQTIAPKPSMNPNAEPIARTIEFVTPNALRCHCPEYRVNGFCVHLVYYTAAKIAAHLETFTKGQSK